MRRIVIEPGSVKRHSGPGRAAARSFARAPPAAAIRGDRRHVRDGRGRSQAVTDRRACEGAGLLDDKSSATARRWKTMKRCFAARAAMTALWFFTAVPAYGAAAAQKTVVLVHGAFADGSSWDKVIPLLLAKGLKVVAVQSPLTSLADD